MAHYPKELPVFEIIKCCEDCKGLHTEGAPTIWGGKRIDVWSSVGVFEPYELENLKPLNKTAKNMVEAVKSGVKYPANPWTKRGYKLLPV